MAQSPWRTATELLDWVSSTPEARVVIRHFAERRAIEDQASAAIKNDTDARLYRENLARIDHDEEAMWDGLKSAIVDMLASGVVLGFGYTSPDSELTPIRPRHWHFLDLDFDRSRAFGSGLSYSGVRGRGRIVSTCSAAITSVSLARHQ